MDYPDHRRPCTTALYLLILLFGINSNLATNSLWIQLPTLMPQAPEGASLPVYFVTLLECANLAAMIYVLIGKYASHKLSEVPFIYSSYALSLTALFLTALLWQTYSQLNDRQHSFILLICGLLAGLVSCMSAVTYIPYCGKLRSEYVTALLLGDVISAAVPHMMALAQGISENPSSCSMDTNVDKTNKTVSYRPYNRQDRGTTPAPLLLPNTRFEEKFFFFAMAGVVFISGIAFIVVRRLSVQYGHLYHYDNTSPTEDEVWQGHIEVSNTEGTMILDDGSVRHNEDFKVHDPSTSHDYSLHHQLMLKQQQHRGQRLNSQESQGHSSIITQCSSNPRSSILYSLGSQSTKFSRDSAGPPTFPLLIIITFWATCVSNGPLSSVKAHACYPTGNNYFLAGVLITNLMKAISCPVSMKLYSRSRITVIVALTSLATITLAYFAALIGFNHTMGSKDSIIFASTGELLGTIAWVTVVGLFSLALSTIGAVCAEAGEEYLLWYSTAVQAGTAVGTLFLVKNMSICKIYRVMYKC